MKTTIKKKKDRFGNDLSRQVKKFRKQFKNKKPPDTLETPDDMLEMFFNKVAQSESWTKTLLRDGF